MREEPIALTTLRFILWLATVNFTVFIYCSYLGQQKSLDDMKVLLAQQQNTLIDLKKSADQQDSTLCECRNLLYKYLPVRSDKDASLKDRQLGPSK